MGIQVCMGATLQCSFGAGTSVLGAAPKLHCSVAPMQTWMPIS